MAPDKPSQEMNTYKRKCEAMEQKCSTLQKDLDELQKKAELTDSLQEEVKTYNSPFTLGSWIPELEVTLKEEEKRLQGASDGAITKTRQVECLCKPWRK